MKNPSEQSICYSGNYSYRDTAGGALKTGVVQLINSSEIASSSHPGWRHLGSGDVGGVFFLKKTQHQVSPGYKHSGYTPTKISYQGPLIASVSGLISATWQPVGVPLIPNVAGLEAFGTSAIAKSAPTNPSFSLATFLGEAREGLPTMFGNNLLRDRSKFLRGAGKEYLNKEFGWDPLMNDLRNFAHTVKKSNKTIEQYVKGSDTKIRRRHSDPQVLSSYTEKNNIYVSPTQASESASGTGTQIKSSRKWFSGAFRYHIPLGNTARDKIIRYEAYANKLLGTRLTPEVVWNLAPWSWAIDWFTNTGDIMHNISVLGHDGLVLQYGYAMNQIDHEEWVSGNGDYNDYLDHHQVYSVSRHTKHSIKFRIPASPYGFGITDSSLSAKQIAVVAALGLSKS